MSAPGRLRLLGRHWATPSAAEAEWRETPCSFVPERLGLVAMHLWNVGEKGGPPVPREFFVDMGTRACQNESLRIAQDSIRPAMDAARTAGMTILHVEPEKIAEKYPQYPGSIPSSPPSPSPVPDANPGWKAERANRTHGQGYADWEGWRQMRVISCCEPGPEDPVVATTAQLDTVCRSRGITALVYTGFAANMCVLEAPGGAQPMLDLGYRVFLIREATLAVEYPDTFEERLMTRAALHFFEQVVGDTMGLAQFVEGCRAV